MKMTRSPALLALTMSAFVSAGAVPVSSQEEQGAAQPWALSLAAQLSAEKRCDVQVTYFVREMPSAEGILYSGRVRCIDGREFDFSQSKPHLKFDLKACEPAAC